MAVQSLTVHATAVWPYWYAPGAYNYYYGSYDAYVHDGYVIVHHTLNDTEPKYLLIELPDLKETLGNKILYRVEPTVRITCFDSDTGIGLRAQPLQGKLSPFPAGKVYTSAPKPETAGSFPNTGIIQNRIYPAANQTLYADGTDTAESKSLSAFRFLSNRVAVFGTYPITSADKSLLAYVTLADNTFPIVTIYYDDSLTPGTKIKSIFGPMNGYKNPRKPILVSFILGYADGETYRCLDDTFNPLHEIIYWRESGAGTWETLAMPDESSDLIIPANTFPPEKSIEWYLSVTDVNGHQSQSEVYTFSTTDGTSTALPQNPIESVQNGAMPITFEWTVSNSTGEPPSRVKAVWATTADAEEWTELFDESSSIYSYEAPAGTFPGGNIFWKVTSYNADGIEGPTSDAVVFQCIAPPNPPIGIQGNGAPYTTISWQATTQTAFEIQIDGIPVVKQFGTGVYSYKLTDPLPDGEHEVSIRVQGAYGYWSNPGTATIQVSNEGTGTVMLEGNYDVDAEIRWACTNIQPGKIYHVYRDGHLIANTSREAFTDRMVLGTHGYSVIAELPDGNFIQSDEISGTMDSSVTRIAPLSGGEWLPLNLSENSNSVQAFSWNRELTLRHYAGSPYPIAEISPYIDRVATYDCAFSNMAEAAAFETLRGLPIILKSRGGEVLVGVLAQLNKTAGHFYSTYSFSVQQIYWEDLINDTNS